MAKKTLEQLLHVAKLYGVFYLQSNKTKISYCLIMVALITTSQIIACSRKTTTEFTTEIFMERMTALVLFFSVVLTVICYTFFTQTTAAQFLEVMDEIATIASNLQCSDLQANVIAVFVNYLLFFSAICLWMVMQHNFQLQSLNGIVCLFVLLHSANIVIFSLQVIQSFYKKIFKKFRKIMVQYLTLPQEDVVHLEEGNFVITGWIKTVLEKRKDEKIESAIVCITAAVDKLNIAVYLFDKMHRFYIVVFFVVFTTLTLEIMNTLLLHHKDNPIKLLENLAALIFIPFLVSMYVHLITQKLIILHYRCKFLKSLKIIRKYHHLAKILLLSLTNTFWNYRVKM